MTTQQTSSDSSSVEGHLRVIEHGPGGSDVVHDDKNQLTENLLTYINQLLTQRPSDEPNSTLGFNEYLIRSLWVEASGSSLSTPTKTDTSPEAPVVYTHVFNPDQDIDTQVGGVKGLMEFNAVVPTSEANGYDLRAVGLYNQGDSSDADTDPTNDPNVVPVARQIFGPINKTSQINVEFRWRIQFSIS